VVPALCALAESFRVTGRDTLVAMVAGYDVGDRVAEGLGGYRALNDRGWHSTGTCGTFAAAAAAARSLSLTADTFCDALGIASGFTGGTWAFLADGAMTKRYHPGKAAETGLMAALLAHSGMTGPRMALEAEWGGLLGTYVGSLARPEAVVLELGRDFKILNDGIKPYACCRSTHGAVDIVLDLRQDGTLRPERIRRVIFHGTEANRRQLENQHVESVLEAQFSLPYTVAVAAVYGRATLDLFRPVRSSEPAIRDLMARVEMLADRPTGGKGEADLEIVLDDGSVLRRHVPTPRGDPRNPLSGTQLEEKAERLIVPVLGARTFEEIVGCVNHLEKLSSLSELTRLLALDREPTGGR
jgi:2-methylcitrate dehydratase PrpD